MKKTQEEALKEIKFRTRTLGIYLFETANFLLVWNKSYWNQAHLIPLQERLRKEGVTVEALNFGFYLGLDMFVSRKGFGCSLEENSLIIQRFELPSIKKVLEETQYTLIKNFLWK